jgi:hypothetical protein
LNINFGFKDTINSLTSSAPSITRGTQRHCCLGLASRKDIAPILEVKQLRNTQAQNRRQIASAESRGGKQIGRRRARALMSESTLSIRRKPTRFLRYRQSNDGFKIPFFATSARGKPDEKASDRRRRNGRADSASERSGHRSATADEGLQYAGKRHDRRRPKAVHEFLPQRTSRRNERASLHQGETVREFLHRPRQGLPQMKAASGRENLTPHGLSGM